MTYLPPRLGMNHGVDHDASTGSPGGPTTRGISLRKDLQIGSAKGTSCGRSTQRVCCVRRLLWLAAALWVRPDVVPGSQARYRGLLAAEVVLRLKEV